MKWLEINNLADDRAELTIYGFIGDDWWDDDANTDKNIRNKIKELSGKSLDIRINSTGGSVFHGMAIYSAIKAHDKPVTIYIDGLAASIASVIACASDDVRISEGAQMMIHNPMTWGFIEGDAEQIEKEAAKVVNALKSSKEAILNIYESKTGMGRDELTSLMDSEKWYTAHEAVEAGFCSEVVGAPANEALENSFKEIISSHAIKDTPRVSAIYNAIFTQSTPKTKPISNQKGNIMGKPSNQKPEQVGTNENAIIAQIKAKEAARREAITNLFDRFPNLKELKNQCLLDSEVTIENANTLLIDALANSEHVVVKEGQEPVNTQVSNPEVVGDRAMDGIKAALKNRAEGEYDYSNEFSSITPVSALMAVGAQNGHMNSMIGRSHTDIVDSLIGDPQTAKDFSILIKDFAWQKALFAYNIAATTWQKFTEQTTVKDFRENETYAIGSIGSMKEKGVDGKYVTQTLPDAEKQSYGGKEYGLIIQLDRKAIINDNWNVLEKQAQDAGHSAALTIEQFIYNLLLSNPVLADGKPLFDDSRGNILKYDELVEEVWNALADHYESLTAPNSKETFLLINQKYMLSDSATRRKAIELITKETGKESKSTIDFFAKENLITSPLMRGKPEIYLGDTQIVQLGWVGKQGPQLRVEEDFNTGAFRSRITADFGAGIIGWRGAATRRPKS
ncbi:MAG: Clp protease ClpP [Xanthomonadaceae bacterium]|nr:Clp protease ClpP [Xanthomonadaceae bacterium]